MKKIEEPTLRFINSMKGSVEIPCVGVHLHWDLSDEVAWLTGVDGGKIFATDSDFSEIRDLWGAVFRLTHAFVDQDLYPEADLALLNSWATRPGVAPTLGVTGLTYHCSSISEALTLLASEVVSFLGKTKPGHIKRCPGCSKFLYDPSPTGKRKWCSMAKCGNQAKVRAFNQRKTSSTPD